MELCPECGGKTVKEQSIYCTNCAWWNGIVTVDIEDVPFEQFDPPLLPETDAEKIERLEKDRSQQIRRAGKLFAENCKLTSRVAELERALTSVIDAANSFQEEDGYEVAGQVRIRARAALEGKDNG